MGHERLAGHKRDELKRRIENGDPEAERELEKHRKLDREDARRRRKLRKERIEAGDRVAILTKELEKERKRRSDEKRRQKGKKKGSKSRKASSATDDDDDDYVPSEDCMDADKDDEEIESAVHAVARTGSEEAVSGKVGQAAVARTGLEEEVEVLPQEETPVKREIIDLCGSDEDSGRLVKSKTAIGVNKADVQSNAEIQLQLEKLARRKAKDCAGEETDGHRGRGSGA